MPLPPHLEQRLKRLIEKRTGQPFSVEEEEEVELGPLGDGLSYVPKEVSPLVEEEFVEPEPEPLDPIARAGAELAKYEITDDDIATALEKFNTASAEQAFSQPEKMDEILAGRRKDAQFITQRPRTKTGEPTATGEPASLLDRLYNKIKEGDIRSEKAGRKALEEYVYPITDTISGPISEQQALKPTERRGVSGVVASLLPARTDEESLVEGPTLEGPGSWALRMLNAAPAAVIGAAEGTLTSKTIPQAMSERIAGTEGFSDAAVDVQQSISQTIMADKLGQALQSKVDEVATKIATMEPGEGKARPWAELFADELGYESPELLIGDLVQKAGTGGVNAPKNVAWWEGFFLDLLAHPATVISPSTGVKTGQKLMGLSPIQRAAKEADVGDTILGNVKSVVKSDEKLLDEAVDRFAAKYDEFINEILQDPDLTRPVNIGQFPAAKGKAKDALTPEIINEYNSLAKTMQKAGVADLSEGPVVNGIRTVQIEPVAADPELAKRIAYQKIYESAIRKKQPGILENLKRVTVDGEDIWVPSRELAGQNNIKKRIEALVKVQERIKVENTQEIPNLKRIRDLNKQEDELLSKASDTDELIGEIKDLPGALTVDDINRLFAEPWSITRGSKEPERFTYLIRNGKIIKEDVSLGNVLKVDDEPLKAPSSMDPIRAKEFELRQNFKIPVARKAIKELDEAVAKTGDSTATKLSAELEKLTNQYEQQWDDFIKQEVSGSAERNPPTVTKAFERKVAEAANHLGYDAVKYTDWTKELKYRFDEITLLGPNGERRFAYGVKGDLAGQQTESAVSNALYKSSREYSRGAEDVATAEITGRRISEFTDIQEADQTIQRLMTAPELRTIRTGINFIDKRAEAFDKLKTGTVGLDVTYDQKELLDALGNITASIGKTLKSDIKIHLGDLDRTYKMTGADAHTVAVERMLFGPVSYPAELVEFYQKNSRVPANFISMVTDDLFDRYLYYRLGGLDDMAVFSAIQETGTLPRTAEMARQMRLMLDDIDKLPDEIAKDVKRIQNEGLFRGSSQRDAETISAIHGQLKSVKQGLLQQIKNMAAGEAPQPAGLSNAFENIVDGLAKLDRMENIRFETAHTSAILQSAAKGRHLQVVNKFLTKKVEVWLPKELNSFAGMWTDGQPPYLINLAARLSRNLNPKEIVSQAFDSYLRSHTDMLRGFTINPNALKKTIKNHLHDAYFNRPIRPGDYEPIIRNIIKASSFEMKAAVDAMNEANVFIAKNDLNDILSEITLMTENREHTLESMVDLSFDTIQQFFKQKYFTSKMDSIGWQDELDERIAQRMKTLTPQPDWRKQTQNVQRAVQQEMMMKLDQEFNNILPKRVFDARKKIDFYLDNLARKPMMHIIRKLHEANVGSSLERNLKLNNVLKQLWGPTNRSPLITTRLVAQLSLIGDSADNFIEELVSRQTINLRDKEDLLSVILGGKRKEDLEKGAFGKLNQAVSGVSSLARKGMLSGLIVPNAKFHTMNMLSGPAIVFSTLGPTKAIGATLNPDAYSIYRYLRGESDGAGMVGDRTVKEVGELAKEMGVLQSQAGLELKPQQLKQLEGMIEPLSDTEKLGFGNAIEQVSDWYADMADAVDGAFRLNVFSSALREGRAPAEAAQLARASLFNYDQLTRTERRSVASVIWFYRFWRQNMMNTFDAVIRNPRRLNAAKFTQLGREDGDQPSDWKAYRPLLTTFKQMDGDVYELLGPDIPTASAIGEIVQVMDMAAITFLQGDLAGGGGEFAQYLGTKGNPWVQLSIGLLTPYDVRTERGFSNYIDPRLAWYFEQNPSTWENFRKLCELEHDPRKLGDGLVTWKIGTERGRKNYWLLARALTLTGQERAMRDTAALWSGDVEDVPAMDNDSLIELFGALTMTKTNTISPSTEKEIKKLKIILDLEERSK